MFGIKSENVVSTLNVLVQAMIDNILTVIALNACVLIFQLAWLNLFDHLQLNPVAL